MLRARLRGLLAASVAATSLLTLGTTYVGAFRSECRDEPEQCRIAGRLAAVPRHGRSPRLEQVRVHTVPLEHCFVADALEHRRRLQLIAGGRQWSGL